MRLCKFSKSETKFLFQIFINMISQNIRVLSSREKIILGRKLCVEIRYHFIRYFKAKFKSSSLFQISISVAIWKLDLDEILYFTKYQHIATSNFIPVGNQKKKWDLIKVSAWSYVLWNHFTIQLPYFRK